MDESHQIKAVCPSVPQSGLSQRLPHTKVQPNSFCFGKQHGKQCSVYTGEIVFKARRQQTKEHLHFLLQRSVPQSGLSQRLPHTKVQPNSFCFGKQHGKQCSVYTGEIVFKARRQQTKEHLHFLLQSC